MRTIDLTFSRSSSAKHSLAACSVSTKDMYNAVGGLRSPIGVAPLAFDASPSVALSAPAPFVAGVAGLASGAEVVGTELLDG